MKANEKTKDRLLRVKEVAEMMGYEPSTVRDKLFNREWPFVKLRSHSGRPTKQQAIRIRESFLLKLIEECEVPARKVA